MAQPDNLANQEEHWRKTSRLMWIHLGVWFFFGYVIHMFVVPLNKIVIPILGFPLGFYMAAQGSLIAFVVMLFASTATPKTSEGGSDHGHSDNHRG
jgi:putative solute:sodium symporter small subunit